MDDISYKKKGNQGGNVKRYESREVVRMCPGSKQSCQDPELIETEGERQLHQLAKRQIDTNVTLEGQLKAKKTFTPASTFIPLGQEVGGWRSMEQFRALEQKHKEHNELREIGLTPDEIKFKVETETQSNNKNAHQRKGYGIEPEALSTKKKVIQKQIDTKSQALSKPDTFADAKPMGRHEMELEKTISQSQDKAMLLNSLVTMTDITDPSYQDINHPINHLDDILQEALRKKREELEQEQANKYKIGCVPKPEGWLSVPSNSSDNDSNASDNIDQCTRHHRSRGKQTKKKRKKSKKTSLNQVSNSQPFVTGDSGPQEESESVTITNRDMSSEGKLYSQKVIQVTVELVPKDVISNYRLSIEEIKHLERFKDYEPGIPYKTLFLKNISNQVVEADLVSLFNHFQQPEDPKIIYRLMKGKMKGQAFVSFCNEAVATEALQLVNGYHYKGKPIIIQYGKKSS